MAPSVERRHPEKAWPGSPRKGAPPLGQTETLPGTCTAWPEVGGAYYSAAVLSVTHTLLVFILTGEVDRCHPHFTGEHNQD